MSTVHAFYENGVFRPREPVALPEGSEVEFEPRIVTCANGGNDALASVYEILGKRFESTHRDLAAHHDEHQP